MLVETLLRYIELVFSYIVEVSIFDVDSTSIISSSEQLFNVLSDDRNGDVLHLYDRVHNMDTKDLTLCTATLEQSMAEKQAKREKVVYLAVITSPWMMQLFNKYRVVLFFCYKLFLAHSGQPKAVGCNVAAGLCGCDGEHNAVTVCTTLSQ